MAKDLTPTPAAVASSAPPPPAPASAVPSSNSKPAAAVVAVVPAVSAESPTTIAITLAPSSPPIHSLWQNGTVLVAGFAFFGVLVTVLFAHIRMRRELAAAARSSEIEREQTRDQAKLDRENAALEAHKERVTTTRRQVYLEAIESLGHALMFLGSLPNQDFSKLDYQASLGPLMTAVNKVAVVGEMGTVKLAREMATSINRWFFRGMIKALPISLQKSTVAGHHAEWEVIQVEIKRLLAALTNHNEAVKNDPVGFEALMASLKIQQQRAKCASSAEQQASAALTKEQLDFADFAAAFGKELAMHVDVLADSIRRELDIETDLDVFREQTVQQGAAIDEALAELKADLKKFQESEG